MIGRYRGRGSGSRGGFFFFVRLDLGFGVVKFGIVVDA